MRKLWKIAAAVVVVAVLFSFVAVQSAQAVTVTYVAGWNCSPLSGSGANNTATCTAFGHEWMVAHEMKYSDSCSLTYTMSSDPWTITQPDNIVDGSHFKSFNLSAAPLSLVKGACGGGKAPAPDNRANHGHGDDVAAIYLDNDASGKPDIKLYCITPEGGYYGGEINQAMLDSAPVSTEKMTLVKKFGDCRYPVSLYRLYTGEFQLSFGPNGEGHVASMVFTGLPLANVHYYDSHLWDTPSK